MVHRKSRIRRIGFYAGVILLMVMWLTPLMFLVFTSLKTSKGFYSQYVFAFPQTIAWENFSQAFSVLKRYILNDILVCVIKVPLGILLSLLAAFALTRLRIKRATLLFCFFLVGMMIPHQVALMPLNMMLNSLGMRNTYQGLIIVYLGFGLPFSIMVLRGFMRSIPGEVDEAALIDGANSWQLLFRIIAPVCMPAIATLVILDFLSTWNEYVIGSVLISRDAMRTISAGLARFTSETGTDYPRMCAGVLICVVPTLTVYLLFQKYFVEGVSGAVKG